MREYFTSKEFDCKCGCGLTGDKMDERFMERLYAARVIAGIPFRITSGIRCQKHNSAVGGEKNSSHLSGHAADIAAVTSDQRFEIVDALIKAGFTRIGSSRPNFIHVDADPYKADGMW